MECFGRVTIQVGDHTVEEVGEAGNSSVFVDGEYYLGSREAAVADVINDQCRKRPLENTPRLYGRHPKLRAAYEMLEALSYSRSPCEIHHLLETLNELNAKFSWLNEPNEKFGELLYAAITCKCREEEDDG